MPFSKVSEKDDVWLAMKDCALMDMRASAQYPASINDLFEVIRLCGADDRKGPGFRNLIAS
jgi:hypothetical protein